jgi:hypothetical protein
MGLPHPHGWSGAACLSEAARGNETEVGDKTDQDDSLLGANTLPAACVPIGTLFLLLPTAGTGVGQVPSLVPARQDFTHSDGGGQLQPLTRSQF